MLPPPRYVSFLLLFADVHFDDVLLLLNLFKDRNLLSLDDASFLKAKDESDMIVVPT